jgi:ubiquinone/menaquinone biosynthesis C-methylase UbiE
MIRRARRRLSGYPIERLTLSVGDVTALDFGDASFDAVFDFAIVHHIPEWRRAVAEVRRVLRPGGRFFFEEVTRHALDKAFYRVLMKHPEEPCWFGAGEFVAELEAQGLEVGGNSAERGGGDFVFGVARREPCGAPARAAV